MERCLRDIDHGTPSDVGALPLHLVDALGRERVLLRQRLAEPDMYFVVTPAEAEAHFIVDVDGQVRADEVERRRMRLLGSDAERG